MAASIIENLHRKNMNSKDMAEYCNFLTEKFSSKTKAAKALGISTRTLKSYLGFEGIPESLKELVPKTISRNDATRLYRIIPNTSTAIEIAHKHCSQSSGTRVVSRRTARRAVAHGRFPAALLAEQWHTGGFPPHCSQSSGTRGVSRSTAHRAVAHLSRLLTGATRVGDRGRGRPGSDGQRR